MLCERFLILFEGIFSFFKYFFLLLIFLLINFSDFSFFLFLFRFVQPLLWIWARRASDHRLMFPDFPFTFSWELRERESVGKFIAELSWEWKFPLSKIVCTKESEKNGVDDDHDDDDVVLKAFIDLFHVYYFYFLTTTWFTRERTHKVTRRIYKFYKYPREFSTDFLARLLFACGQFNYFFSSHSTVNHS